MAPNIEQYVVEVRGSVRTEVISRFLDINNFKLPWYFTIPSERPKR